MPRRNDIFALLDMLIEQTRFGNVKWQPTDEPFEWRFRGTEASVVLSTVDKDGELPVRLSIRNKDGRRASSWVVSDLSTSEEAAFDTRVRELFRLVSTQEDPVASLIRDLDNMPPF